MTAQRSQMNAPFAEEELRTFQGRGGKTMTFIEDETVMDRLDLGYGPGNWQIQVDPIPTAPNVVKVRLGVLEDREWVWYEDFGYPNSTDGETLKEAVSDGIRRCGRYVGIARDLYRKSTYEKKEAAKPAKGNGAAKPTPIRSTTTAPEPDEDEIAELYAAQVKERAPAPSEEPWDYARFRLAMADLPTNIRPDKPKLVRIADQLFPTKDLPLVEPKNWKLNDRDWRQLAEVLAMPE